MNDFRVNSTFGRIDVEEDGNGAISISQNGQSIRITPDEIQKLAGCLYAYKKDKYPQPATNSTTKPSRSGGSYMSKQKEKFSNAYKPWTPEEEARLKELHDSGMEPKEIGVQLGRNEGSILARLDKISKT